MTAVVASYPSDKAVVRCVLTKVSAQNLAGEARKRFTNHDTWLQNKAYDLKLQKERKKQAEEREKQKKANLAEELKRKDEENQQKVQQWMKEKMKEFEKKTKDTIVVNVKQEATETQSDNRVIQEWTKLKSKQKETEKKEKEERLKLEEEKTKRRRALSGLCYEQWMEKAKLKHVEIPRNGYQIFGPKPTPVVPDEWVTPKISSSIPAMNNPRLFIISSFRSEPRMFADDNSERSFISKLDLGHGSAPPTPWGQVTGGYHARGMTKRVAAPALAWTDRSKETYCSNDTKKQRKKKPIFRP